MVTTKAPANGFKIPEMPEVKAAQARFTRMQQAKTQNERETKSIISELNGISNNSYQQQKLDQAADVLLETGEVPPAQDAFSTLNDSLQRKWKEAVVIKVALENAERQMDHARAEAGKQLAQQLRPQYNAVLKRMKAALVELQAAVLEEHQFAGALEEVGFTNVFSHLPRMTFVGAGFIESDDQDPASHIRTWLNQLKEYHPGV